MEKQFIEKGSLDSWEATHVHTDLMYVLAEGWDSGKLTDEVEVGSGDCVNSTAVEHRQSLVSGQSQILDR